MNSVKSFKMIYTKKKKEKKTWRSGNSWAALQQTAGSEERLPLSDKGNATALLVRFCELPPGSGTRPRMDTWRLLYSLAPVPPPWPLFLVFSILLICFIQGGNQTAAFPWGWGAGCISVVPSGISHRDMCEAPSTRHLTITAPSDTRLHCTNVLSLMRDDISFFFLKGTTGWDGWMASPTQWTWVWVNSGSWWWTGRLGVLQSMGSQRVGHDWATEWRMKARPYRASAYLPAMAHTWQQGGPRCGNRAGCPALSAQPILSCSSAGLPIIRPLHWGRGASPITQMAGSPLQIIKSTHQVFMFCAQVRKELPDTRQNERRTEFIRPGDTVSRPAFPVVRECVC